MSVFLAPISWIYAIIVKIRNWLYDEHILRSHVVNVPTICVGNISVGGAGKTPHVEYIASRLSEQFRVAVLSRGYHRKTSGFVLADENSTVEQIGDEAMQMFLHLPNIPIAVCERRVKGIKQLLQKYPDLQVVVLDDGFQHRQLRCGYNIILTPHKNIYVNDHLLPWGTLREPIDSTSRAETIIVTKCPPDIQPIDRRVIISALKPFPFQQLYFSTLKYQEPRPVFPEKASSLPTQKLRPLIVTGIVYPEYIADEMKTKNIDFSLLSFSDHHKFTKSDIKSIESAYKSFHANCILTTEKDAVRLKQCPHVIDDIKQVLYTLPVKVEMLEDSKNFINNIIAYVTENSRNR